MKAFIRKNYELLSLVAAVVIFLVVVFINHVNPLVCIEKRVVVEILELQYRDVIVLLDNGKEHTINNQPVLKPGDSICVQYERQSEV